MTSLPPALQATKVSGGYRHSPVLTDITFELRTGRVIALLGPNGAGKTTLLSILATVARPSSGELRIRGLDPRVRRDRDKIRRNLGYLPQNFSADESLTVSQFVSYSLWMRCYPSKLRDRATTEAIDTVGLGGDSDTALKSLSGGMRQRAGIAAAVAGHPQLIIVDEPTAGLDPQQRAHFRALLRELHSQQHPPTVLLSTHLVEDVVSCADDLLVINSGQLCYQGPASVLGASGATTLEQMEHNYTSLISKTVR
ncbi:ATP-binding cassette domain-containing protein [Corynebacterium uberis]|nr:ATP-binding cassette domain-containing protein [Corynebacterium uberis]UDL76477.1 ATP-binding cassette domain-containing protein [Corynebacterium uberis]UDL78689.1 ATP-binding cassette domain-containing protein [Corynebacterium uberis]UDL80968.1 ATP-binding cassette domain-containing protein [Corynebacterium uberis]UDL83107.1 ATP-binding cassette domain-containing protein [Corynebacterium uberis]